MASVPEPLTYTFKAFFDDGSEIIQSDADKSSLREDKSAFFDVSEKQKTNKLLIFALQGRQGIFIVDLVHMLFTVNDFTYSPLEQDEVITDPQIIYFRETFQHNTLADGVQPPYIARYFLGFKGKNENGKVVKKLINIES